jgi:MFS family permease
LAVDEPERASPWSHAGDTFRIPHFFTLWSSNLIQFASAIVYTVLLGWLVTSLTESRTVVGLVGFVQGGVMLLASPLAGVAVDRLSKRRLLVVGRLGLAGVVAAIAVLVASGRIEIWHILVASLAAGLLMALTQPATQTYVFDVVRRQHLQSAVSLNAGATSVAHTAGPLVGGALVGAIGFVGAYVSAAAGLVLSALLLLSIPVMGRADERASPAHWASDLRQGLAYVWTHPPVRLVLIACSLSVFNGAVTAMRPIFARHVLGVDSLGYGAMAGAAGLGGLVTAVAMAGLPSIRRPGPWIVASMLAFSLLIVLYAFAFSFEYILVIEFLSGAAAQIWMVSTFSGLQMAVPDDMRGRVVSLVFTVVMLAPVGGLFVGLLADTIGDRWALGIFGIIPATVLAGLLVGGYRSLRKL